MTAHRLFRTAAEVAQERQAHLDQPTEEYDTLAATDAEPDTETAADEQAPKAGKQHHRASKTTSAAPAPPTDG